MAHHAIPVRLHFHRIVEVEDGTDLAVDREIEQPGIDLPNEILEQPPFRTGDRP